MFDESVEDGFFRLDCRVPLVIGVPYEPDDFITDIRADVVFVDETGVETKCGNLHASVIRAADAEDDGTALFEVCDAESQELCDFYGEFFTSKGLRKSIETDHVIDGALTGSILYLHSLTLDEKFRRKGHGLKVIYQFITNFSEGCALIVLEAAPLRTSTDQPMDAAWRAGAEKLARYWARLGFQRGPGRYLYFDPSYKLTSPFEKIE